MNESDMQKANSRVVGTIGQIIRDETYEALQDYDLRMEEEAEAAAIVVALTPTYTGLVYDDKGYTIDERFGPEVNDG
jgi:arginine/lysine/ornithine decarboxylase